ncbi:MAG: EAL domain-containing protein, partial [Actinomycetota bacterium]|nr:EAL domain-containing protein [Actinomycetota bacterium]
HLEFDYLKIDGEFIVNLVGTETDQLLVKAVVDIARGLGTQTVAEFVGDEATVAMLRKLRVDFGQGFHLGRPVPVDEALPPLPGAATPLTAAKP